MTGTTSGDPCSDALWDLYQEFAAFEIRARAHDLDMGGVRIWSAARSEIFRTLAVQKGVASSFQPHTVGYRGTLRRLAANVFRHNPFLARRPARTAIFRWARIHAGIGDPISDALRRKLEGTDVIQIESAGNALHSPDFYSLDTISMVAKIAARLCPLWLTEEQQQRAAALEQAVDLEFGVTSNLQAFLLPRANRFRSQSYIFYRLFKWLGTRQVYIVVAYGTPDIVDAARRAGARSIELQHGLIFPSHTGYDFPPGVDAAYRPDEIMLFGDHWRTAARHAPSTQLSILGAEHIRRGIDAVSKTARDRRTEGLLVLSQPAIAGELLAFALQLSKIADMVPVLYRLHPGDDLAVLSRQVEAAGVDPARFALSSGGGGGRTMELQADYRFQLGVFSTAVVEGVALGCQTLIAALPGWSALSSLVDQGVADLVATPAEAADLIARGGGATYRMDTSHFFA